MYEKLKAFEGTSRGIEKFMKRSDEKKRDLKKDDDRQRQRMIDLQDDTLDKLDDLKREIEGKCNIPR